MQTGAIDFKKYYHAELTAYGSLTNRQLGFQISWESLDHVDCL